MSISEDNKNIQNAFDAWRLRNTGHHDAFVSNGAWYVYVPPSRGWVDYSMSDVSFVYLKDAYLEEDHVYNAYKLILENLTKEMDEQI